MRCNFEPSASFVSASANVDLLREAGCWFRDPQILAIFLIEGVERLSFGTRLYQKSEVDGNVLFAIFKYLTVFYRKA